MKYLSEYKYHHNYLKENKDIDWTEDWEEDEYENYDYPEDFKEFLKEHDALKKFVSNTKNNKNIYNTFGEKYFERTIKAK